MLLIIFDNLKVDIVKIVFANFLDDKNVALSVAEGA